MLLTSGCNQVDYEEICQNADQAAERHMQPLPSFSAANPSSRRLTDWAESLIGLEERVKDIMAGVTDKSLYLPIVRAAYANAFQRHPHLTRFVTLEQRLSSTELDALVGGVMNKCRPFINEVVKSSLRDMHSNVSGGDLMEPLKGCARNCIIKYVVAELKLKPLQLQSDFQFVEDEGTVANRKALERKRDRLFNASEAFKLILARDSPADPVADDPEQPGPSDPASLTSTQPFRPFCAPMEPILQRIDLAGSPTMIAESAAAQPFEDDSDFEDIEG